MMVLAPSDAPRELLRAVAQAAESRALLRTERLPPGPILTLFPLTIPPEAIDGGEEATLVAQDYGWIRWAKERDFKAIWYNPAGAFSPEPHPLHDGEIRAPQELANVWESSLPDLKRCLRILKDNGVPANVVEHSLTVAVVAHFLAERLRAQGLQVDPLLVHRGALLHDLDKIKSLDDEEEHGLRAAEILRRLGYPELGHIAQAHVLRPGEWPPTWPEKVVFLADKLVEGQQVVGLEARLAALKQRYPQFCEKIRAYEPSTRDLLNQVLSILGWSEPALLVQLQELPTVLPLWLKREALAEQGKTL